MSLLLTLLLQDESLAEKARRLAKDPVTNREALLKLGSAAIRPLLEVRTPELEPILLELRFPAPMRERLRVDRKLSLKYQSVSLIALLDGVLSMLSIPCTVDPHIRTRLDKRMTDLKFQGTANDVLRLVCKEADLEYGFVRDRVVVSTAERLWAWPGARGFLDRIAERAGRLARPTVVFVEKLAFEKQTLTDGEKAAFAKTVRLHDTDVPLSAAFKRLLFQTGLDGAADASAGKIRVDCAFEGMTLADALYFLAIPNGHDVTLKDGRLYLVRRP